MDKMDIVTKLIPILLVIFIVYYNMRKMKRNMDAMKQEHCTGSCHGCAHSATCSSQKRNTFCEEEEKK